MTSHVLIDRLQFTLTITFDYLFPILTMGLALNVPTMCELAVLTDVSP